MSVVGREGGAGASPVPPLPLHWLRASLHVANEGASFTEDAWNREWTRAWCPWTPEMIADHMKYALRTGHRGFVVAIGSFVEASPTWMVAREAEVNAQLLRLWPPGSNQLTLHASLCRVEKIGHRSSQLATRRSWLTTTLLNVWCEVDEWSPRCWASGPWCPFCHTDTCHRFADCAQQWVRRWSAIWTTDVARLVIDYYA